MGLERQSEGKLKTIVSHQRVQVLKPAERCVHELRCDTVLPLGPTLASSKWSCSMSSSLGIVSLLAVTNRWNNIPVPPIETNTPTLRPLPKIVKQLSVNIKSTLISTLKCRNRHLNATLKSLQEWRTEQMEVTVIYP